MKKIALMMTVAAATLAVPALTNPAMAQNSAALCKIYTQQGGSAAVPAAYQSGVDVNGNPVVPADGGVTPAISAPGSVRIPVTVDLARALGVPVPGGVEMDAPVGVANISSTGAVSFNGQDITAQTAALCAQPYTPAVSSAAEAVATPASAPAGNGFDYDAAWSPSKAAAAGVMAADGTAAPAPIGMTAPSAPLAQGTVVPAQPSLADEPAYVPPAVVPAMPEESAPAPAAVEAPADAVVEAPAVPAMEAPAVPAVEAPALDAAVPADSAVQTMEPAPSVVDHEQQGAVHPQSGAVTEQDGIIYGEGR